MEQGNIFFCNGTAIPILFLWIWINLDKATIWRNSTFKFWHTPHTHSLRVWSMLIIIFGLNNCILSLFLLIPFGDNETIFCFLKGKCVQSSHFELKPLPSILILVCLFFLHGSVTKLWPFLAFEIHATMFTLEHFFWTLKDNCKKNEMGVFVRFIYCFRIRLDVTAYTF